MWPPRARGPPCLLDRCWHRAGLGSVSGAPACRPWVCPQDTHVLYVLAAANLYARMHGLPGSRDLPALRGMLERLPQPEPQQLEPLLPGGLAPPELGEAPRLPPTGLALPTVEGRGRPGPCSQPAPPPPPPALHSAFPTPP